MTDSRLRLASAVLGLVGLGLLLSLLPRTSFVSRSAGDIVDAVGPVWPEQSVEQVMDDGLGVVSEIRIWGAAGADRGEEAPVVAALLQGPDRELVRQDRVGIKSSHLLQPYVLEFPPFHPVPGEELILQLYVTDERKNHAIFGTTEAGGEGGGPTLNLNPTGKGPLAYEVIWRGDGWRAALAGSWLDRLRLAGGIAGAVLAVGLSPPVARRLRRLLGRLCAAVLVARGQIAARLAPVGAWLRVTRPATGAETRRRPVYIYPWLIPAFAILHYLANNVVLLPAHEAIVPGAVIMAGVTVVFVGLRLVFKSSASAALITGVLGMAFFSFGHIYVGPEDQPDSRHLLGIAIPAIVALVILVRSRSALPHRIGRVLNYASVALLAAPLSQFALVLFAAAAPEDRGLIKQPIVIDERVSEVKAMVSPDQIPDIYLIILDAYPRDGSPASFDNSEFIGDLEDRGFYVDPQARSNYASTASSILSALYMSHLDRIVDWGEPTPERYQAYNIMLDHSLGNILTNLGYTYVHVSSGWFITKTSRNADVVVEFTPRGTVLSGYTAVDPFTYYPYSIENAASLSNSFMVHFLQTTFFKYFDRRPCFDCINKVPGVLSWAHPFRSLQWIDYMKELGQAERPKFVLAHFIKPHVPISFDRHGNIAHTVGDDGTIHFGQWDDDHDPEFDSAFYGQVAWLNSQLLDVIDSVLTGPDDDSIIVIMSDHGYIPGHEARYTHDILAAYRLPNRGASVIYPGITPVNAFRVILDYYFELGLGRVEDQVHWSENRDQ